MHVARLAFAITMLALSCLSPAHAAKRVAFVVGIGAYTQLSKLSNPVRDAERFADLLKKNGFDVHFHKNLGHAQFVEAAFAFQLASLDAEVAVVFYAGHGMTVVENNRLVNGLAASDARINCETRQAERIFNMSQLIGLIAHVPKQILLFDSCRDDPIAGCESTPLTAVMGGFQPVSISTARSAAKSLQRSSSRSGSPRVEQSLQTSNPAVLIGYSTALGQTAADGPRGGNSPFAAALLKELETQPKSPFRQVLDRVSERLAASIGQRPWVVTDGGEPKVCLSPGDCETSGALRAAQLATKSEFLANLAQRPENEGATGLLLALAGARDETPVNGAALADRPAVRAIERALYDRQRDLREKMVLTADQAAIQDARFAAAGALIVTSGKDQVARLWDAKTGQLRIAIEPPASKPSELILQTITNADATRLATINRDRQVHVWNGRTGDQTARLDPKLSGRVTAVSMSPDSHRIVTVGGSQFRLWNAASGALLGRLHFRGLRLLQAVFSPDGRRIAVASTAGSAVWILDAATLQVSSVLKSKRGEMLSVVFAPDSRRVATSGSIGPGRLWDVVTGAQIAVLDGRADRVSHATFSRDGTRIMMSASDNTVHIWDAATSAEVTVLREQSYARAVDFNADASRVVTGHMDGVVRVWDVETGKIVAVLRGHRGTITSAMFSPDGTTVLSASEDGTARLWDVREHPSETLFKAHSGVEDAAFSPDGAIVATAGWRGEFGKAGWRGEVRLWDARTGAAMADLKGHDDLVWRVAFDPTRNRVASASRDGSVRLWDIASGQPLKVLTGGREGFQSLAYSPDGRRLAAAALSGDAVLWDGGTGERIAALTGHEKGVWEVAFSPDGRKLVTVGKDPHARVWDAATGKELMRLTARAEQLRNVAFSPDGSRIATSPWGGPIQVWDAETGREIAALKGQHVVIASVAFNPAGTKLISTGTDILTSGGWLWDINAAKKIWRSPGMLIGGIFSPDGRHAVVTGDDGQATILDVASGEEIAKAAYVPAEIKRPSFSSDGKRLLLVRGKFGATAVRHFATLQELTDHAKRVAPRCLTLVERKKFELSPEPERWCITGAGREAEKNPAEWAPKWPYRTAQWRDWLAKLDRGEEAALPEATEEAIQW